MVTIIVFEVLGSEVSLKGSAKNHYKRCENHFFPDAVGHHIQGNFLAFSVKSRLVYEDGKQEVLTEKREFDDDKIAVTARGLEGHLMDQLKVYDVIFQFIPKTEQGCVCKVTMIWEQRRLARTHQLHEIRQELGC
ncbi:hypothetical protein Bca52824_062895 [Brassica carinata]|uniref:Bet v I/Major latex protein domain-containing protein n=1 Tax=Brassica carinata TaxID=52824 RepID=A0A8X7QDP9_BRACI|nr:hypothetical protein Bca52824_062895 [Brassica carinata]